MTSINLAFKRRELQAIPQYCASEIYTQVGKWVHHSGSDLLIVKDENAKEINPLYNIVVGIVSSAAPYLDLHGNYNPKYSKEVHTSKLQFTLTRPNNDVDFVDDYDTAIQGLKAYQEAGSNTQIRKHFILDDGASLRFNFPLFEPKQSQGQEEDIPLPDTYKIEWRNALSSHQRRVMPVYDTDDYSIKPQDFKSKLVGALVEVVFVLRHYPIRAVTRDERGESVEVSPAQDTFSAIVESVSILKKPPVMPRSPYGGRRKPKHHPQFPSRSEHLGAAESFLKKPDFSQLDGASNVAGSSRSHVNTPSPAPTLRSEEGEVAESLTAAGVMDEHASKKRKTNE